MPNPGFSVVKLSGTPPNFIFEDTFGAVPQLNPCEFYARTMSGNQDLVWKPKNWWPHYDSLEVS